MRTGLLNTTALRSPDMGSGQGFTPTGTTFGQQMQHNNRQQQQQQNNGDGNGQPKDDDNKGAADEAKDFWSTNKDFWSNPKVEVDPAAEAAAQAAREKSASNFKTYVESQNFMPEIDAQIFAEATQSGDPTKLIESIGKANQKLFQKTLTDMNTMFEAKMRDIREEMKGQANKTVQLQQQEQSLVDTIPSLKGNDVALKLAFGIKSQFMKNGKNDAEANAAVKEFLKATGQLVDGDTNPGSNRAPNGPGYRQNSGGDNFDWDALMKGELQASS